MVARHLIGDSVYRKDFKVLLDVFKKVHCETRLRYENCSSVVASNSNSTEDFLALGILQNNKKKRGKKTNEIKHFLYSDGLCMTRI